jgi:hypothetical protein
MQSASPQGRRILFFRVELFEMLFEMTGVMPKTVAPTLKSSFLDAQLRI